MNPKISIIIPTYNRENVLPKTLDSIIRQTFEEWECLIVDDHSTDNTLRVLNDYVKDDTRFKCLVNSRKKGAQGARNTGLLASRGDLIVFFDSDDTMHKDFLEKVYNKLVLEEADVCGSYLRLVDQFGTKLGTISWGGYGRIHRSIMKRKSYFCNDSTIMSRQKLFDIGMLDEECPSYQEWDTHIRLSRICTYTMVEECLVDYYQGGGDTISSSVVKDIKGLLYIMRKYQKEWLVTLPRTYFCNLYDVYTKIQSLKDTEKYMESKKLYNNTTTAFCNLLVRMAYSFHPKK